MPAIAAPSKLSVFWGRRTERENELIEPNSPSRRTFLFFRQLIEEGNSTSKFLEIAGKYRELRTSLHDCNFLTDNWDSYDAPKPERHSMEMAEGLLRKLFADLFMANRVIPSAEGGVAIYFNNEKKTAYVEYRNSGSVILAMYDDKSDPIIIELSESDDDQSRALSLIKNYISA